MRSGLRGAAAGLTALLLLACHHSAGSGPGGGRIGEFCSSNLDCISQVCLQDVDLPYCSARCSSGADCGGLTCGVRADGSKACLNPCTATFVDQGFTCKDGVPTACALAGPESCADCGCPAGSRCQVGVGCGPQAQVGEACDIDEDCQSSNCSRFAGVCRVAIGEACIADNCDHCLFDSTGWSFCSRECDAFASCGSAGQCLGDALTNIYTCRPSCVGGSGPRCQGTCKLVVTGNVDTDYYYCDCPTCQSVEPKRELGQICRYSSDCKSAACQPPDPQSCFFSSTTYCGTCTETCANDADCGGGLTCARVCDNPQAASCGGVCLRQCTADQPCIAGSCRMLVGAGGASVLACDSRRDVGGACAGATDCLTARCVAGACAPAEGVPNGSVCNVSADCKSNSCVSGHCKGNAQIGEACAAIIDCATGTCCSNICKTAC